MSDAVASRRFRLMAAGACCIIILLVLGLAPRVMEASTTSGEVALRNTIAGLLDRQDRPSANWGVYVQNLRTGEIVFSRNANQSFVPASNMKLLTVAAALDALGPDHRFATELHFRGTTAESVLRGDLILRGSGDPTFGSSLFPGDPLAHWARQLSGMGVTRIEGRLIGDASVMDSTPFASGWDIDYIATRDWAPSSGGLSYSDNLVSVQIAGTRAGQHAEVLVTPDGYVNILGSVETRGGRGFSPFKIDRHVGTNDVVLEGAVSGSYRGTVRLPIHDPTRFTLHSFAQQLQRQGITVAAEIVDAAELDEAPSYDEDPILVHLSPPLLDMLALINQRSNNFYAEQVFRAVSASGTARASAQRITSYFQQAGISTTGLSIRDGSGLSRKNLVTPQTLGQLLAHQYDGPHRDAFISTLARGGQPNSTMRFRLGGTPVWAKTGTIEHTRALAGYVTGPANTPYVFVLLANNFTANPAAMGTLQNEIVQAIATGRSPN